MPTICEENFGGVADSGGRSRQRGSKPTCIEKHQDEEKHGNPPKACAEDHFHQGLSFC
jgi:hypothetical protein